MSSEWQLVQLSDVAKTRNGAGIKQQFFTAEGVPLARVSNFTDTAIDLSDCIRVCREHAEKWENHRLKFGDILVATVGSWPPNWSSVVGKTIRVSRNAENAIQNQNTCCVIAKPNKANQRYLYYVLRSTEFAQYAANSASGSANQARLPVAKLDSFSFHLPSLDEQIAISNLLGSIDDRIALLRETNAILEAIAQALFKSWFVDFDPVHAKHQGRAPEGMDEATAALFPDSFEESELDLVPKGWRAQRLETFIELAYGKALKSTDRVPGDIPVYGSGGITGYHNKSLADGPSVIVGRKGTVGSLYWEDSPFFPIDTVFFVKSATPMTYCFYLLQTLGLNEMNTDAAVPGLNRNNVYRLTVPYPTREVLAAFDDVAKVIRERIFRNQQQAQTLATLRDTLLPRLISGRLRLPEAEASIEESL